MSDNHTCSVNLKTLRCNKNLKNPILTSFCKQKLTKNSRCDKLNQYKKMKIKIISTIINEKTFFRIKKLSFIL